MKKIIASTIVIGLLLSIAPLSIGREEAVEGTSSEVDESLPYVPDDESEFAPGEFIIKFREDVDICLSSSPDEALITGITLIDMLNQKYGVTSAEKIFKNAPVSSLSNVYKFILGDDADIPSIVEEYNSESCVVYAEPNYVRHVFVIPNDPYFDDKQWALHNTGQEGGTPDADIDAPEAWDIETGNENITIAIIDTGVYYSHKDLDGNIWINSGEDLNGNGVVDPDDFNDVDDDNNGYIDDIIGFDFANSEDNNGDGDYNDPEDINDPDPMDDNGHGTHCAGIAGAVTNNNEGIAGVCWNCRIMPVKVLNHEGWGYDDDIAEGICYAADNGADVISMSLGGYFLSQLIHDAIEHAYEQGVVPVASAGNEDIHWKSFPAGYDHVIAVAATDRNDEKADFSNYGSWVDVAAPGVSIYSTMIIPYIYWLMSGTSMACPHVAGLAALILSKNECSNPPGVAKTLIVNTADPISSAEYIGSGRINAYQALLREPAIAILDVFPDWTDVKGIVDINGWAWSEAFQYYTVAYGRGGEPDSWTEIKYSTNHVQDDVLAVLDTTELDEGLYTIRLTVTCSDGIYTDKSRIAVNNEQNTIHVDADNTGGPWYGTPENPFMYIRDGVDDAGKDDTVYTHSGTYHESKLFIEKTIDLTGEDRDTTIIDGNGKGDVIFIIADSVNINGFTIKHSSAFGCGIWISSSCDTSITGNIITGNYYGILLMKSPHDNIISGNTITYNNKYGIRLYQSSYNTISENTITHNPEGISLKYASYNNVYGNNITNNEQGISITKDLIFSLDSINNNIYQNNITNNNEVGIRIFGDCDGVYDNNIYHNNFIGNNQNAYDECDNIWYNVDLEEGNYWDDYNGIDINGDGIGDIPSYYKIPDGDHNPLNNNKDMYPLMGAWPNPYNNNQASQQNSQSNQQNSQQSSSQSSQGSRSNNY